jgi:peptidyl-prolyl cis-trans isomerase B (cyclophilin B)
MSSEISVPKKSDSTATTALVDPEVAIIRTSQGEMIMDFWPDVAPATVANFTKLAKAGFYDGTCFHRVIRGFMIQGGDPLTKDESQQHRWGTGDPGYKIQAEFNPRRHERGVISMARSQHADSAGSQFFICHQAASSLDGKYTAFGKLIQGEDVLDRIANTPCTGSEGSRPLSPQVVLSVKIVPRSTVV